MKNILFEHGLMNSNGSCRQGKTFVMKINRNVA